MNKIVLIAHNLRSSHNVGSLLRTAEGLGIDQVYLSGYTPYPEITDDERPPHIRQKVSRQIQKTALDAQLTLPWRHVPDIEPLLAHLGDEGFTIAALEQTVGAIPLPKYQQAPAKLALIVGSEVEGVEPGVLAQTDLQLVIPMLGHKESFNVVQATAMALYHMRFMLKSDRV